MLDTITPKFCLHQLVSVDSSGKYEIIGVFEALLCRGVVRYVVKDAMGFSCVVDEHRLFGLSGKAKRKGEVK